MPAIDPDSFDYQERAVAFIDVLGFAELVKQSAANPTARANISKLIDTNRLFERFTRELLRFAEAAFFSDTFVLSMHSPEIRLIHLIREAGQLCRRLLLQGFPCRGAITTGSLYHQNRFVVGPALVVAHRLEQSVAVYPRVILDDPTISYWENEFRGQGPAHRHLEALIKRDRDGQRFLDIFHPAWGSDFIQWTEFIPSGETIPTDPVEFLNAAWTQIARNRATHIGNLRVLAKWEWLASECNQCADALGIKLA